MKTYSAEEVELVGVIDWCEWAYWCLHEMQTDEEFKRTLDRKKEAIKTLKEKFGYADKDIREAWEDLYKVY